MIHIEYQCRCLSYTLFQNGRHFSILFDYKLALLASLSNVKFKRIFKTLNEAKRAVCNQSNEYKNGGHFGLRCLTPRCKGFLHEQFSNRSKHPVRSRLQVLHLALLHRSLPSLNWTLEILLTWTRKKCRVLREKWLLLSGHGDCPGRFGPIFGIKLSSIAE